MQERIQKLIHGTQFPHEIGTKTESERENTSTPYLIAMPGSVSNLEIGC